MRNITPAVKNLLLANIFLFAIKVLYPQIVNWGGLHFFCASDFYIFQFITYMFLHANFMHIFFNMFALWMFGCVMENMWGTRRFMIYFMVCGIGAGIVQELAQMAHFYVIMSQNVPNLGLQEFVSLSKMYSESLNSWNTIGASGAVYGILLAFGMTFPDERLFIFPIPIPIKAKWLIMFYVAVELFFAFGSTSDGVAHMAHLGGMLFGFLLIRHWRRIENIGFRDMYWRPFFSNSKQNVNRMRSKRKESEPRMTSNERETDWEYNAKKKSNQEEIDRILDKIRKSGYDSLTKEEKLKLFDNE